MATPRATPSPADRAAILAARAWGERPWGRLDAAWQARLRLAKRDLPREPGPALEALRAERAAHDRPAPSDVHPSWLVRALQGELPAVRRAVVARLPGPLREELRAALAIPAADLDPPHEPLPEAVAVAGALWTERLVGGPGRLPDDPPIVRVLAGRDGHRLTRLAALCALAKRAYLARDDDLPRLAPGAAAHLEALRPGWDGFRRDADLERLARLDLRGDTGAAPRDLVRIGLLTLGRLLATAEATRARWALQHLPYPVAKRLRTILLHPPAGLGPALLLAWEGHALTLAAARLLATNEHDPGTPPDEEGAP